MSDVVLVESDRCGLDGLFLDYGTAAARGGLGLGPGWPRRWASTWKISGGEVACAARDLGEVPVAGCEPVRRVPRGPPPAPPPGAPDPVSAGRLHGVASVGGRALPLAPGLSPTGPG